MKIVTFWGGLGNQLFEYAYFKWLEDRYPGEKIYGYYPKVGLSAHNGLEINKRFELKLPSETTLSRLIGSSLFNLNRLLRKLNFQGLFTCTQSNERYDTVFHCDYWQDKKYINDGFNVSFRTECINQKNLDFIESLSDKNTVAVHIRRGDYLSGNNKKVYGGICTEDYYRKALSRISSEVENPQFLFFSDEPSYVIDTFSFPNMTIVDWNRGEDSFMDMYLMSRCKYMILANSTFSYWSARLNDNAKMIICPSRWNNISTLDIALDDWIKY